jgi:hypothetical protein
MASLASASPCPRCRSRCRILTCKNGSVMPPTSCSGLYPVVTSDLRCLTRSGTAYRTSLTDQREFPRQMQGRTFLNSPRTFSSTSHISFTSVTPANRTPWLRSERSDLALSRKWSISSGTRRMTRIAQRAAWKMNRDKSSLLRR